MPELNEKKYEPLIRAGNGQVPTDSLHIAGMPFTVTVRPPMFTQRQELKVDVIGIS
jgi:hypothetical protein